MHTIEFQISNIQQAFTTALENAHTLEQLEDVRVSFLGRNGQITQVMSVLKELSPEDKRLWGPKIQQFKKMSEEQFEQAKKHIEHQHAQNELLKQRYFDVTASYKPTTTGSLHIYTHIIEKLENIFISMGFEIVAGPEVETDFYNFSALNIPADHPARDLQDTFWLTSPGLLLRTHTSTVQIRTMEKTTPPIAIFAPGRVYRNEATDASHDFQFYQGEALLIDKNISVANLLATAQSFLQEFFEQKDLKIRVRPGYFPFVEPGLEIDASCPFCTTGCTVCKYSTWIELLGSGLVHPNVLRACNINPEVYSGFAFGFGIDRLAMVKYGITDIRLFRSASLDFLKQF